jgi:LptD protein/OstA-like protein
MFREKRPTGLQVLFLFALLTGCAGPVRQTETPSPVDGVSATIDSLVTASNLDSLAVSDSTIAAAADTSGVTPAPPTSGPVADTDSIPPQPAEPWHMSGQRLEGQLDGPIEIDGPIIHHGDLHIRAARGFWNPQLGRAELFEHVVIQDSVRTLYSDEAFYYKETRELQMNRRVRGTGPEGDFTSDTLNYDRSVDLLKLGGAVHLKDETHTLDAHWLNYNAADSVITAGGKVDLYTLADSVRILGNHLYFDRARGCATITSDPPERPRLIQQAAGDSAGIVIIADSLRTWTDDRAGEAFGNVEFERDGIRGTCGNARIGMAKDRIILSKMPRIEEIGGWVAGDSMAVELRGGRADKLLVWSHAHTGYQPAGRPGEVHYSAGDSLTAYLGGGTISSVLIEGAAQSLYLPSRTDKEAGIGLNWTSGNRMRLIMENSEVQRIQYENNVTGRYVLPAEVPDSIATLPMPAEWDPAILDSLETMAARGDLAPSDSLTTELGFSNTETVGYSGNQLEFEVGSDTIYISGDSRVRYQNMDLAADDITFDSVNELVIARGNPVLKDPGSEVHGDVMTYRLDNRKGLIYMGRSTMENAYYRGERIKRIDKDTFYVKDGDYTSCDAEETHFHFHSEAMKVVPGEKVFARPVVLYIGNIPVMAIPYAVFPIRKGRHSGILMPQFEFGFDNRQGRFIENVGYYFAPNDYTDGLFWLDYFEHSKRIIFNGKTNYKVRYKLDGWIKGSYMKDDLNEKRRWDLQANHRQTLGERFTLTAYGKFLSDKNYNRDKDFGAGVDDLVDRVLRSQMSISKSWSGASLSVTADRTENLDEDPGGLRISQSVPSINLRFSSFPLGSKPNARGRGGARPYLSSLYLSASSRYRCIYQKTWADTDSLTAAPENSTLEQGAGLSLGLRDKRKLMGSINVTPNTNLTAAWTRKAEPDEEGKETYAGAAWNAGVSANTTVYGTFFPHLGGWEGMRHVIDLSASYSFQPEIPSLEGFRSVGGIGLSSSKSSRVSLRVNQRFHIKWLSGEEEKKKDNLLTWSSSTGYDFLAREKGNEPWSSLRHSLQLKPGRSISTSFDLTHDLKEWRRQSLSFRNSLQLAGGSGSGEPSGDESVISTTGGFGDPDGMGHADPGERRTQGSLTGPWRLTVVQTFTLGEEWSSRSSGLNVSSSISLTSNWRVSASVYYDLDEHEVIRQGFVLTRDLHCWRLNFEKRGSGYYFRINVLDLPDIKYERTRY